MRVILLTLCLLGAQAVQAESVRKPIIAGVVDGQIKITFFGQAAKDIYDGMPENSKVLPTKKCRLAPQSERIGKVKGGFICSFYPQSNGLNLAYICILGCVGENREGTGAQAA